MARRLLQPAGQLHRCHFPELRWQRRQRHLAQGALVVAGGKTNQLSPGV